MSLDLATLNNVYMLDTMKNKEIKILPSFLPLLPHYVF